MKEDITLLIQGKYSEVLINNIENYYLHFKEIIYSTWNDSEIKNHEKIRFLINEIPQNIPYNEANIYYQCLSTLNGLNDVKTKYVLKHRSDEYYSNIDIIIDSYNKKLLCSNIFFLNKKYKPYQISDHFFLGETNVLKESFFLLEKYLRSDDEYKILNSKIYSAEMLIALHYISVFLNCEIKYLIDNKYNYKLVKEITKNCFEVIDVNKLKPMIIKRNSVNKTYTSFDDLISIKSINELI